MKPKRLKPWSEIVGRLTEIEEFDTGVVVEIDGQRRILDDRTLADELVLGTQVSILRTDTDHRIEIRNYDT